MNPFYITGLPRSRTAWLSTFFSTGPVACLHEPFGRVPFGEWDRVVEVMEGIDREYVGIADTGMALVYPEIVDRYPGPSIIVARNPGDVLAAINALFPGKEQDMEAVVVATAKALDRFKSDHPEALLVPYEALENEDAIRYIWNHLVPGAPWSQWWYEEMSRKQVEVIIDRLLPKDQQPPAQISIEAPPPPPARH